MLARMGVLYDYFAASSDEVAAAVIELPGGPGAAGRSFDTITGNGVDPVVQMGTLEALLTGRATTRSCRGTIAPARSWPPATTISSWL